MFKMGRSMARRILAPGGGSSGGGGGGGGGSGNNQDQLRDNVNANNTANSNEQVRVKTGDDINDFSKLEQDPRLPLNVRQIFKITKSWKAIARTMSKTGTAMFLNLFEQNQDLFYLFSRFQHLKGKDLHESMELREHAATVMSTLDQSITLLSDYDNFVAYLHSIGKLHRKIPGFKRDHFWKIEQPFLKAVKHTLDERCNETIEEIYKIAIKLIIETIAEGYGNDDDNNNNNNDDNNNNNSQNQGKTGGGGSSGNGNSNGKITPTTKGASGTTGGGDSTGGGGGVAGDVKNTKSNTNQSPGESPTAEVANGRLSCEELIEMTSSLIEQIQLNSQSGDSSTTTTTTATTLRDTLFALSGGNKNQSRNENHRDNNSNINNNDKLNARREITLITDNAGDRNGPNNDQIHGGQRLHDGQQHETKTVARAYCAIKAAVCRRPRGRDTLMAGEGRSAGASAAARCQLAPTGGSAERRAKASRASNEQTRCPPVRGQPSGLKINGGRRPVVSGLALGDQLDERDDEATTNSGAQRQIADGISTSTTASMYSLLSSPPSSPSPLPTSSPSSSSSLASSSPIAATMSSASHRKLSSEFAAVGLPISGHSGLLGEPNEDNGRLLAQVDCCCPGDVDGHQPEAMHQHQQPILASRSSKMAAKGKKSSRSSRGHQHHHHDDGKCRLTMTGNIMRMTGIGRLVTNFASRQHRRRQPSRQQLHSDCRANIIIIDQVDSSCCTEKAHRNGKPNEAAPSAPTGGIDSIERTTGETISMTTNADRERGDQIKVSNVWNSSNGMRNSGGSRGQPDRCPLSNRPKTTNLSDRADSRLMANEYNHTNNLQGRPNYNEQSNGVINSNNNDQHELGVIDKSKLIATKLLEAADRSETNTGDLGEIMRMLILINKLLFALAGPKCNTTPSTITTNTLTSPKVH